MKNDFAHVNHWIFDLDNTLYPPAAALFDQIEVRMTDFVARALNVGQAEANLLRHQYWRQYGTTLSGLMREHGVDPEPYLVEVHQIDLGHLEKAPDLREGIARLPGRKIVYTNGSAPYAERVVAARGLSGVFDALYGVEHADFHPKPDPRAFGAVFARDRLRPETAAMFEDDARNLAAPHRMGMRTVHVADTPMGAPHIHHHTDDLSGFLARLV